MAMDAQTLREKRAKLIADARAIRTRADQEKRDLTAEEIQQQAKMLADAKLVGDELRPLEQREQEESIPSFPESQRDKPKQEQDEAVQRREKLRSFLLAAVEGGGPLRLNVEATAPQQRALMLQSERRTMNTLSAAAGGYSVAPDTSMYGRVIEALKFFGGIEAFGATVLVTSTGADLPIATDDDTANVGAIVAEEGSHTGGTDVTMGQKVLKAYLYSSKIIKFSIQLVQDGSFDIEGYLGRKIVTRIGRILNTHQTTGTGGSQP